MAGGCLSAADWQRVCRDLAFTELAAMPGLSARLGGRVGTEQTVRSVDWSDNGLALDSLTRMQLATAAASWCNAYDSGFEDLFLAKRSSADWALVMQRAQAAGSKNFTFATSGSTGAKKYILHRESALLREAQGWAELLQSAPGQPITRVVNLVPTCHIYGLVWGVLLPQALGVPVVDADWDSLGELQSGDCVIAVPDQWTWLAGRSRTWPPAVRGISSTAPLDEALHRQLTQPGALSQLLHIYGSTETGGVGVCSAPGAPFLLAANCVRTPADGIALRLPGGGEAALAVQDTLQWHSADEFFLEGRLDLSVQIGGYNVSPAWVREQLLAQPQVAQAAVRLNVAAQPPRLKAFVVLKAGANSADFEQALLANLPWYAAPSALSYGPDLPRNGLGKLCDWP